MRQQNYVRGSIICSFFLFYCLYVNLKLDRITVEKFSLSNSSIVMQPYSNEFSNFIFSTNEKNNIKRDHHDWRYKEAVLFYSLNVPINCTNSTKVIEII